MLIEVGGTPRKEEVGPGLYHIGLKIGDDIETLKTAVKDLQKNNIQITGSADHTVTKSLYINDPDGNEIELYVDVSDEWKKNPKAVLNQTKPLQL